MGNVTHTELRDAEVRFDAKVEAVRTETRETTGKFHDRLNEVANAATAAETKADAATAELEKQGARIDDGEAALREVHGALENSTQEITLWAGEMKLKREAEAAKKVAQGEQDEQDEKDRKDWWKRWWSAVTPTNIGIVLAAVAALSAFTKGQIDQSQLIDRLERASAIEAPVEEPEPPSPEP